LGHERIFAPQLAMLALPPKTNILNTLMRSRSS
jgi:hypothetical protein